MIGAAPQLAERLSLEGEKTLAFFASLQPEQYQRSIYTEGTQWNPRQILAHFVSAEAGFQSLIENILAGGQGVQEGFDIDRFNEKEVSAMLELPVSELVDRFSAVRIRTVDVVRQLSDEDLARSGRHPFLGLVPVESMVKLIYRHNQMHLRDIRRAIQEEQQVTGRLQD
jgi:hypothetical protein